MVKSEVCTFLDMSVRSYSRLSRRKPIVLRSSDTLSTSQCRTLRRQRRVSSGPPDLCFPAKLNLHCVFFICFFKHIHIAEGNQLSFVPHTHSFQGTVYGVSFAQVKMTRIYWLSCQPDVGNHETGVSP